MIYVSQGHESGIGLEVFLKAVLQLPQYITSQIELHANEAHLRATATSIGTTINILNNVLHLQGVRVRFKEIELTEVPVSSSSLLSILDVIGPSDILITLPTSKDQLIQNETQCSGYTEFFRSYFQDLSISMVFHSRDLDILLLTDHIALKEVTNRVNLDLVVDKTTHCINGLEKFFTKPKEVLFAGINPHAGENGILGTEDPIINKASVKLRTKFPDLTFSDALPGDTLHFHKKSYIQQLFTYSFHDQGLPFFKDKYGLFGINVTLGLPFLRLSVDHGTAFELYGKNMANSSGLLHVFYSAYKVMNR